MIAAIFLGSWASSAVAAAERIRENVEIDFSSGERFFIATGLIDSYSLSGNHENELIETHEVILRIIIDEEIGKNAELEQIPRQVEIIQWLHSGFDRLFGKRVLIVFDRENENVPVRMIYAQEIFCMDENIFVEEEWDVLNIASISAGCFKVSQ